MFASPGRCLRATRAACEAAVRVLQIRAEVFCLSGTLNRIQPAGPREPSPKQRLSLKEYRGSKAIQTTPPQDWIARPSFRASIQANPTRSVAQSRRRSIWSGSVECSRTVVVVLAVEQRSTTVPAHARRQRRRLAARRDLTIAGQVDDVAGRRYVFLNHGCSSRLTHNLSQTSFAQTFSAPLKFYRRNWGTAHASQRSRNGDLFCDTISPVFATGVRSRSLSRKRGAGSQPLLPLEDPIRDHGGDHHQH